MKSHNSNISPKKLTLLSIIGCAVSFSSMIWAGEYYKWVDESGTPHFSERPPTIAGAEKIKTSSRKPTPEESKKAQDVATETADVASTQQTIKADPERCRIAQDRLKNLSSGSRIRLSDGNGGFYYLEKNQIAEEIKKSNRAIEESCGK